MCKEVSRGKLKIDLEKQMFSVIVQRGRLWSDCHFLPLQRLLPHWSGNVWTPSYRRQWERVTADNGSAKTYLRNNLTPENEWGGTMARRLSCFTEDDFLRRGTDTWSRTEQKEREGSCPSSWRSWGSKVKRSLPCARGKSGQEPPPPPLLLLGPLTGSLTLWPPTNEASS